MLFGFGCVDVAGVAPGNDHWYVDAFCDVLVKLMQDPLQSTVSLEKKFATGVVHVFTVIKLFSTCEDEQLPFDTVRKTL